MSIKESALTAITAISNSDFVRAVTSAGASRRITVANLAKQIVEGYAGSSLAGSSQSVKSAIDSLNSNSMIAKTVLTSANNLNQLTTGVYTWNTSRPQNLPEGQDNGLIVVFEGSINGVFYNFQLCSLPGGVLYYRRKKGNSDAGFAAWARVATV